jgi:mercuric ion binding protein
MKCLVPVAAIVFGLLGPGVAAAAEQTVKLAVGNMYCAACPAIVQQSLSAVSGVAKVAVSYEEKSAVVTFDDQRTTVDALIAAATNAGYPTKLAAAATTKAK